MDELHVGFVGAGQIGAPMVQRLLAAGRKVSVWVRSPATRSRLGGAGANLVDCAEDLADADVLGSCLFDDGQLLDVLPPILTRMRSGATVFSHTTGSPSVVAQLADLAGQRGISVVDAAFSGDAAMVRSQQLTVLLGGPESAVGTVEEVVRAYASTVLRTGTLGTALVTKLLNNLLFAAHTQLALSALTCAASLEIEKNLFLRVLASSSGGSAAARYLAAAQVPAEQFALNLPRYLAKDVASAVSVAGELGLDITALESAARLGPMDLLLDDDGTACSPTMSVPLASE
ncbi:NAD(P)-binding domain-containing protein [Nocardia sp. NPDC005366]|uniref:NAD(P)-dependent oxidoreductase n=1 Tax=Nocardia sp. NPDC005366 TaxID=3156878 RepID=UPI0033ABDA01